MRKKLLPLFGILLLLTLNPYLSAQPMLGPEDPPTDPDGDSYIPEGLNYQAIASLR